MGVGRELCSVLMPSLVPHADSPRTRPDQTRVDSRGALLAMLDFWYLGIPEAAVSLESP